ncbi:molybdenum cofactor cytidylyltransferase [Sphingomonas zeicaulis]|uniref:nucleotidyltransferase family protein n=1 Tax=Sphingomonas zeicaulis TaxID=1632740 RepID=UPI003D1C2F40
MIAADRVAALLLAGGLSRRYGPDDKLVAAYAGRPLAVHARDALAAFPNRLAVVRTGAGALGALLAAGGLGLVENDAPEEGMAGSIRRGVAAATALDIDALLICLADMPRIDAALLARMCADYDPAIGLLVCAADGRRMPPALIGRAHFGVLAQLTGDVGARDLLAGAPLFAIDAAMAVDVDRPAG